MAFEYNNITWDESYQYCIGSALDGRTVCRWVADDDDDVVCAAIWGIESSTGADNCEK